jgi:hypothetical protein
MKKQTKGIDAVKDVLTAEPNNDQTTPQAQDFLQEFEPTTEPQDSQETEQEPEEFKQESSEETFEKVSNNFSFFEFSVKGKPQIGKTLIGQFLGCTDTHARNLPLAIPESVDACIMFAEHETGEIVLVSSYYTLKKYFDTENPEEKRLYKIVLRDVKPSDKGTVYIFDYYKGGKVK